MNLKHIGTILEALDGAAKITSLTWSPNNLKLAVATADRTIVLFDEAGEKRDKFSTKPADAKFGKKNYQVKAIAFSPDSTKIAIGQTDNIIYVYKIGEEWGEKKVICNKFAQNSQVTCLIWPVEGPIVYGLLDGKVRAANVKTNKSQTLYHTDSYVVSLVPNLRGTGFLSGHADGAVVRFYVTDDPNAAQQGKVISHPVPPYAMAWTSSSILIAGCDKRIVVYSRAGKLMQTFDHGKEPDEREFTAMTCSPSGQTVLVGSYDRLRTLEYSSNRDTWEELGNKQFKNLYSVTALAWKRDGSRVACGVLCGAVELFDSVLRRSVWKNKWEMVYTGPSQVLVKPVTGTAPHGTQGIIVRSQYGFEIHDVKIMGQDRYLVAQTSETLLLGDLHRNLLSEVQWHGGGASGDEKFYFNNENVCLVFKAGELSLIEYGNNNILESVRTEFLNPHLISVRINERPRRGDPDNKKMAYLLDVKTIHIVDLVYQSTLGQISHDSRIDWLELNENSRKLLFRDKRLRLTLVDVATGTKTTMLSYATFVQWVPGSDVVVAQSREQLCVWYNIDVPDRITATSIKGEVTDVERADGRTEVIVVDGHQELSYPLDEGLIEFGTALDDEDYVRAMKYLETLPITAEVEAMWRTLARLTLEARQLYIAERCFAALGDIAKVSFLANINAIRDRVQETRGEDGLEEYEVQAHLAELDQQFKTAETIYLANNDLDAAMEMYQTMHKWDEAVELARIKQHPQLDNLQAAHTRWLLETQQQERAAQLREQEGEYEAAVTLYLQAARPARAAGLVMSVPELREDPALIERIATALTKAELHERTGELWERLGEHEKALRCYRTGGAYAKAVELARRTSPEEVVLLEEQWGDDLVERKQPDAAISHYIEANRNVKALEAAVAARQWKKATQIVQVLEDDPNLQPHLRQLAEHYARLGDLRLAEKFYLQANLHNLAIQMYNNAGEWERAHRLAQTHLPAPEVTMMYVSQAGKLEEAGKLKEAEKLYVSVGEPDLAITMYKNHRNYDQMLRLVKQYHQDLVQSTHLHLAEELQKEGNYRDAERHYIAAQDWKAAVNMYRQLDMWEEAYRVGKTEGGDAAGKQVAFYWARTLRGDAAVKLLNKFGLLEQCIDYACENLQFEFAFDLAKLSMKKKVPDIHYKYAMALEDDGKYAEAEKEFIAASKPKEAVLMYVHAQDWESAQKVAEAHDPESVGDVLVGQAKLAFTQKNHPKAEALLLRAQRPELAVKFYRNSGQWQDALRVCREYLPHQLSALQDDYDNSVGGAGGGGEGAALMAQARQYEADGEYVRAVQGYMKVTPSMSPDPETVEKAWLKASEISAKHLGPEKALEIAQNLGPQLLTLQRPRAAAQVFLSGHLVKEAIDALIACRDWSRAQTVAAQLEPRLQEYVDDAYKEHLKSEGEAEVLVGVDLTAALDMLLAEGQLERALDTAASHGPELLHKYLAKHASELVKGGRAADALPLYKKYGAPANKQNYNLYQLLARSILCGRGLSSDTPYETWASLRDVLLTIVSNVRQRDEGGGVLESFEELLLLAHYFAARSAYTTLQAGGTDLAARLSVALLRHTNILPADRAFYEAGMACKEMGWNNMAFVFLNRFLDLCEAIEEGSLDALDHADFMDTDVPYEIPLPESVSVPDTLKEEAKEWVLAVSMDQSVEQVLPTDERGCYAASLVDGEGQRASPCVVTGYPAIRPALHLKFGQVAIKEYLNKLLMAVKRSEAPQGKDVLRFIDTWGGGLPNMGYNF